jgi:hypothetical protein
LWGGLDRLDRRRTARRGERANVLLVGLLVVWIVLLPLATVVVLYVLSPRLHRKRRQLEAAATEDVGNGPQENPEIEPQRPVRSVEVVDLDHLVHRDSR